MCSANPRMSPPVPTWRFPALLLLALAAWLQAVSAAEPGVAELLLNSPVAWPPYEKGKGLYKWVLNKRALRQGFSHIGNADRLRVAVAKLVEGKNVSIAAIGGSITAGQGAVDAPNWPAYLEQYLRDYYGDHVQMRNGAVGGTMSSYMSVCLNIHVTRDVDIVFVEYNQNDPPVSSPLFEGQHRKQFERLLRKLLSYPNHPAVVLINSYTWGMPSYIPGHFWNSAEREFNEFALYYSLPVLSVKACCYQLMANNVTGFKIDTPRLKSPDLLKYVAFNWDDVHPDGRTGFRVMAELAMYMIDSTVEGLKTEPVTQMDMQAASVSIPRPMIPDNYQSLNDTCFIGQHFTRIVTRADGFEWINESKGARSKWGMVATKPDSVLQLTFNSMASTGQHGVKPDQVRVDMAYLVSYERMGRADVTCVSGCECKTTELDGHGVGRWSQLQLHSFYVSQSPNCIVQVRVREDSKVAGAHKVKIAGLMVSEEAGRASEGIRNNLAVEYVHDISFQSKSATFDVKNHVRRLHDIEWLDDDNMA